MKEIFHNLNTFRDPRSQDYMFFMSGNEAKTNVQGILRSSPLNHLGYVQEIRTCVIDYQPYTTTTSTNKMFHEIRNSQLSLVSLNLK